VHDDPAEFVATFAIGDGDDVAFQLNKALGTQYLHHFRG
jgi:hypothetical protein